MPAPPAGGGHIASTYLKPRCTAGPAGPIDIIGIGSDSGHRALQVLG